MVKAAGPLPMRETWSVHWITQAVDCPPLTSTSLPNPTQLPFFLMLSLPLLPRLDV